MFITTMIRTRFLSILVLFFLLSLGPFAYADASDRVVLLISGNHGHENQSEPLELKLTTIEELPSETFTTTTPWTEGDVTWEGVRISTLMEYLKTDSMEFKASALDGYEIMFKGVDIEKYPVIIAYKRDGEYMSVRELGPFWIMFPFDDYKKEFSFAEHRALAVWQLNQIEIL